MSSNGQSVVINPGIGFIFTGTICLVTGVILLMWLGKELLKEELVTEYLLL